MARLAALLGLLLTIGCGPHGAVIDPGARPPNVGGTIAGSVRSARDEAPLSARKVSAINEATGRRYEASTGPNGGYTLQVPSGRYRLEVELRSGEMLATGPDATDMGVGDIDSARDFVITRR